MLRHVVGTKSSELQVKQNNVKARKMYEKEGYVEIEEGDYAPQRGYKYMRRLNKVMEDVGDNIGVAMLECRASSSVPRETWEWMERQICEEDGVTRRKAQEILRPRDKNMRYVMAILQMGEKQDVMGRSRRVTMVVDYNEQRACIQDSREKGTRSKVIKGEYTIYPSGDGECMKQ